MWPLASAIVVSRITVAAGKSAGGLARVAVGDVESGSVCSSQKRSLGSSLEVAVEGLVRLKDEVSVGVESSSDGRDTMGGRFGGGAGWCGECWCARVAAADVVRGDIGTALATDGLRLVNLRGDW